MSNATPHHPKSIDIKDVVGIIVRRKWLMVIPLVLVSGIALAMTFVLQPLYRSTTIVWIDKPTNVSRELASIIGNERIERDSREDRARQLQSLTNKLTSQLYLSRLISDLKLDDDPELARQAAKMREAAPSVSLEDLKYSILIGKLRSDLDVQFVGADQIQLTLQSSSPERAQAGVKRLAEILDEEETKAEIGRIRDNQGFADVQLKETGFEYQQALDSLTNARSLLTRLTLPENISSEANRREIASDIDRNNLEFQDIERERGSVAAQLSAVDLDRTRLKPSDTMVELRVEIDGQVARFAELMEKYAWNDQNVVNINLRLNSNVRLLESEISSEVARQFAAYPENQRQLLVRYFTLQENGDILKSKVAQLQNSLQKIISKLNQVPRLESQVDELGRRVEGLREYRDAFVKEDATVEILTERAQNRTRYKVIEPAQMPLAPYWPDSTKILFMGVLLGLVIGGGVVMLVEILDNSFKRIEDVEQFTGLKVLAAVPKIDALHAVRR